MTGSYRVSNSTRAFVRKIDPSGNKVWEKSRTELSEGNEIVTDNVGNSYVTGTLYSSTTNYDIFTTKYDAAGREVWSKTTGGPDRDYGDGIAIDANGNCYISGRFQSNATFASIAIENLNSGISDIFVAKYDNLGDIVWVQQAGESGEDAASKIGVDGAGNCYINGFYSTRTTFGNISLNGIVRQPLLAKIGNFVEGSEAITTLPLASRNYNAGSAISVPFSTKGTFPVGTTFTVELSDPSGSFFFPKYIGVGTSSPINCVLPSLTIPASDYRVRVISSNPEVLGTDNGSAITINGNSQLTTPDWSWAKNVDGAPAVNTFDNGSIFTDTDGNSYIVNQLNNDVNIKKYDASGVLLWSRTGSSGSGIETPKDIAVDKAGNYYVTGYYTGTATFGSTNLINSGQSDIFIVKYNTTGDVLWAQKYVDTSSQLANSIAVDADGNIYIGGFSQESTSFIYLFYAKYDSSGVLIWKKTGVGSNSTIGITGLSITNEVKGISFDSFGNTYITGSIISSSTSYAFIIKCDPSGNTVWQKQRAEFSVGNDIVTDSVGNSYVTGAYFVSGLGYNVFVTKYNAAGVIVWTQEGIGLDNDYGDGIVLDAEGNCFVTGRFQHNTDFSTLNISNTSSGISDVFVAKYDKFGSIVWLQQAGESGQDAGSKIGVDGEGNCYINGYYSASTTFGATTLNGVNFNPFLAKIGVTAATTLVNAVVKGENFCGGAVVTVDFAITGKYDESNVFTAQLSDASGSFINPTNIGTLNSPNNTSIYAIVPLETIAGTGYRIRVISSNPSLVGIDNGIDIKINQTDCKDNVIKLSESPILAIEYFIDTDPGVGKGTSLNTAGGLTVSESFNIVLPTLTAGFHNLFFRTKNADGIWGMYEGRVFYVQPDALVLETSQVVAAEYFFDTEPGVGKGTALPSFASGNSVSETMPVSTTGLSEGFHYLFFRTKNAKGKWSMYEGRVVYLQPTSSSLSVEPIVAAEYFYNTDPGLGKGLLIDTGAELDSISVNLPNLATTTLQTGDHNVFIRVKNKVGDWSLSEKRMFTICGSVLESPVVTGNTTVCPGGTLQLTASDVTGATSYKWTGPNNFTATTKTITINSVTNLNSGEYTVVAIKGTTSCDVSNPTKINVTLNCEATIKPQVFLASAYQGNGLMSDALRASGNLPTISPYVDGISCDAAVFGVTGNDAIVDWVWIELRDKNDATKTLHQTSALLQRDGDVVGVDGTSPVTMEIAPGNYRVMIAHRNHIGALTATAVSVGNDLVIGFSNNLSLVTGGANGIATLSDGKYGLFSGDFNGDGQIQNSDRSGIEPLRGTSGYTNADLDMNSEVQNSDIQSVLNPNIGKGHQFSSKIINLHLYAKRANTK